MPTLTVGTRLGRYEIRAKIGQGGMAEVYLADDVQLGRPVALKVLLPEDQDDEQARKRLQREARAAATLDHPHICAVYEVGEADGVAFIAMQYVDGQTLAARMAREPLALPDVLRVATEITDAVSEAHEQGVLHRDLKPANIMLTNREQVKVTDFGLAKMGRADGGGTADTVSVLSTPGEILGTVPYMSPEQVRGVDLDRRSDLFSLGVIFYEMVCGRRPFDDSSSAATASAILTRDPLSIARIAPETPPELERIIMKALRKNADERYQTAKDLLVDLRALKDEQVFQARLERSNPSTDRPAFPSPPSGAAAGLNRPRLSMAWPIAAVVLIALVAGGWWWRDRANQQWANREIQQIAELAEQRQFYDAYDRAVMVEPYATGHATLTSLMASISDTISVDSEPPGAHVYLKRFAPDSTGRLPDRQLAGTTPLKGFRVARGQYVLSLELDGFAPYQRTVSGIPVRQGALTITPPPAQLKIRLIQSSAMPPNMVFVPGSGYRLVAWSRPTDRRVELNDFFIDKYEVSNRDFKEFITAGGYVKREFWTHPFVKDGKPLTWTEAMALFVDRTKLAGPREWMNQDIPDGKADYPVTGVSWYEASAYAAFRGRSLPTVFEWEKAARNGVIPLAGSVMMPWGVFYAGDSFNHRANFGAATWPVTEGEFGMSPFGAYNMAGNVSEWTGNDSTDGYLATGGSFGDPTYTFAQFGGRPPAFSSTKLGFRLAKPATAPAGDQGAGRIEIAGEVPAYKSSSPELFATLSGQYRYEATPLDARVEETIEATDWTRETVTFKGAWGGERATAYLYLPRNAPRPLQVIHYVPAGDVAGGLRSLTASIEDSMAVYLKTGRAVFSVVLKGYYGRPAPENRASLDRSQVEYAEYMVNQVNDLRRGLDYLESRQDVDRSRILFYGPSAGAQLGLILAAVELRYRAVFLQGAGFDPGVEAVTPAANPVNFASHITAPKFIMQGRYDEDTPLRTRADPLYQVLSEPKQRLVYDGTHVPTDDVRIPAVIPWLNTILGPVIK